jgi:RNA polymerase sigma-70 factor (ECF subfamily)
MPKKNQAQGTEKNTTGDINKIDKTSTKHESFAKLYGAHSDEIFRFALYKLSDREKAKDVVQDTFVRAWTYIQDDGFVLDNSRAFLFKIARNLVIDSYRKVKHMSIDALEEIIHFDISDNFQSRDEIHDAVDMSIVLEALNILDVDDRDIVIMRYVDGLSVKEIADVTGQRENTVSVKIHRALKDMQDHFGIETSMATKLGLDNSLKNSTGQLSGRQARNNII